MLRSLPRRIAAILGLFAVLGLNYRFLVRPALLRWGATPAEIAQPLPLDGLVDQPDFDATRAITIRGSSEQIWPWLAQMGFRRAGFYGYDLIENLGSGTGMRSAQTIVPALQHPRPGDVLPISVAASVAYAAVEPGQYVVWRDPADPPHGVFIWALGPLDATHTRLISRIRLKFHPGGMALLLDAFTEFADHVAVPKILTGVRDRVEGRPLQPLWMQAAEIAGWLLALVEFTICAVCVLFWRRWGRAWLLALGAGFLLQVCLYAHGAAWIFAPLPWLYLVLLGWAWPNRQRGPQPILRS
jgi:hypothetical protein